MQLTFFDRLLSAANGRGLRRRKILQNPFRTLSAHLSLTILFLCMFFSARVAPSRLSPYIFAIFAPSRHFRVFLLPKHNHISTGRFFQIFLFVVRALISRSHGVHP